MNRRQILSSAAAALGMAAGANAAPAPKATSKPSPCPQVCLFSKPLQNRPVADLAGVLPELGWDAVDLTCRPGGHVLPDRVDDDLPRACELLASAGICVPMITTGITDAGKGNAERIIAAAGRLGIRYAKLGYYPYGDLHRIPQTLNATAARLKDITALCRQHGVHMGFHNHSALTIGSPMWDLWQLIRDLPGEWIGSYFDAGHATVEGGDGGWRIGLNLLAPRITMLAVKDFAWKKQEKRGWRPAWCPLGEGMVRWEEVLRRLGEERFAGPISLHVEYGEAAQPGSESDRAVLASIRQDRAVLRELLQRAQLH